MSTDRIERALAELMAQKKSDPITIERCWKRPPGLWLVRFRAGEYAAHSIGGYLGSGLDLGIASGVRWAGGSSLSS
jgi:hypothetical protein